MIVRTSDDYLEGLYGDRKRRKLSSSEEGESYRVQSDEENGKVGDQNSSDGEKDDSGDGKNRASGSAKIKVGSPALQVEGTVKDAGNAWMTSFGLMNNGYIFSVRSMGVR